MYARLTIPHSADVASVAQEEALHLALTLLERVFVHQPYLIGMHGCVSVAKPTSSHPGARAATPLDAVMKVSGQGQDSPYYDRIACIASLIAYPGREDIPLSAITILWHLSHSIDLKKVCC